MAAMENKNTAQLELFSGTKNQPEDTLCSHNSFYGYARKHEKGIIAIICFIITGVILFSLGVEKGKNINAISQNQSQLAPKKQPLAATPAIAASIAPIETEKAETKPAQNQNKEKPTGYTIQVASYKNKSTAKKESENLIKRGLSAIVMSKGAFKILCVGNFTDKETALPALIQIKKKYQDALIRRL